MTQVNVLGIDIAKQIFHAVGMDDISRVSTVTTAPDVVASFGS
jgi:hypothetical protein